MADGEGSIATTPTWAVAAICSVLMLAALLAEHALHLLTVFLLKRRKRKTLNQALYHVKAGESRELARRDGFHGAGPEDLLLWSQLRSFGFMSLLIHVAQQPISKICIPASLAGTFLPCKGADPPIILSEGDSSFPKGRVPLLSTVGTEQLLLFIIMLAVSHVLSCVFTFGLGMAKMRRWESWEEETRTLEYQLSTDPRRFKLTRDTSFGRRHLKIWNEHPFLLWSACFFRQFKASVSKADYLALRHGFIMGHFPQDLQSFDFHKFLRRSLDHDFTMWSWTYAILFIFFNAQGFYSYFWLPVVPLVMLLIVGTKLEVTITRMCLESSSEGSVVPGTLCVRPNNGYFWFGKPRFILQIIHFIRFQNASQVAFFTWTWYKFGFPSCFHRETEDITLSIGIGGLVQILCAYVTLPLHELVTRVGSSKMEIIFTEDITRGLKNWRRAARRSLAKSRRDSESRHTVTSPDQPEPSSPAGPPADPSLSHPHADDDPEEMEQPSDLNPLRSSLLVQQTEETRESANTSQGGRSPRAEVEGAGEDQTTARSDGGYSAAVYYGEIWFGMWQLQPQRQLGFRD